MAGLSCHKKVSSRKSLPCRGNAFFKSKKKKDSSKYCISIFFKILSLAIALIVAWIYNKQLEVMRDTINQTSLSIDVANKQYVATMDANKILQDTAKRQLRAYVSAGKASLQEFKVHGEILIKLNLKNHGLTPASKIKARCKIYLDKFPYYYVYKELTDCGASINLAGGQGADIEVWPLGGKGVVVDIDDNDFYAVTHKIAALYLKMNFSYEDIYHETHVIDFTLYKTGGNTEKDNLFHVAEMDESSVM